MDGGKVNQIGNQFELNVNEINSPLWNRDLSPVPIKDRYWDKWIMTSMWIALSVSIATYMLGSSLIGSGMNWWQAIVTIALGNIIVLIPMVLVAHPGPKYGVPFPVLIRSSFGTEGAKLAAMARAFVACGWFGIQSSIAGNALFVIISFFFPSIEHSMYLGDFVGLDLWHFICIIIMVILQAVIIHHGMSLLKKFEVYASPFLILTGLLLFIWAWWKVGSISEILEASNHLVGSNHESFWVIFWPGLTAIVGFQSTLALNIPDFTRFVKSQKDQYIGQSLGLPTTMVLFSFIGIAVTSATIIIYGKAIWDPVELLGRFNRSPYLLIPMIGLILATVCCNMAANVVSASNDFSNLLPKYISFKNGGIITCVIGTIIFPWKLIADPTGYIFKWLVAYSALLGAVGGVMVCDYYLIRKTKLLLYDLFVTEKGEYTYSKGWNTNAYIAVIIAIIPNLPGFIYRVGLGGENFFPKFLIGLYDYAWFISFILAMIVYYILMRKQKT
ncbi:MAG: NCS1 family nucleobase:cation symporter-1 [Lentisphaerota bacterium]